MDKYEYKLRSEEIRTLVERNEFADAAAIADTIDWRRVKSVTTLCFISEIYKRNRRYTDARDLLLLAYDKRPNGRNICYALCELSIKLEEFVQAVEYYKEFVQIAPKDPARFILQYKLYELQDINLEERIEVLNEYKKYEYQEKWAYELAYLYHRVGMETRCVEECDELILWFGEGKYVYKAMELKMMHQPLTREQQAKYDRRFNTGSMAVQAVQAATEAPVQQAPVEEIPVEEISGEEPVVEQPIVEETPEVYAPVEQEPASITEMAIDSALDAIAQREAMEAEQMAAYEQTPPEITVNVGAYNTIDLQKELAEGLRAVMENPEDQDSAITRMILEPMMNTQTMSLDQADTEDLQVKATEEVESTEIFFSETGEIRELTTADMVKDQMRREMMDPITEAVLTEQPPTEMAKVLSQGVDGQISLVVPEETDAIEKQITGQMNIEEVLLEWERMRKENEAARAEKTREEILQQTGPIFLQFDQESQDTLLEKIERDEDAPGIVEPVDEYDAIIAEEERAAAAFEAIEEVEEIEETPAAEEAEVIEEVEAIEEIQEIEEFEEVQEAEGDIPEAEMDEEVLAEEASLDGDVTEYPEDTGVDYPEESLEETVEETAEEIIEETDEVEEIEEIEEIEEVIEEESEEEPEAEVEEIIEDEPVEETEEATEDEAEEDIDEESEEETEEDIDEESEEETQEQPPVKERKTAALSEGEAERRSREARAAGKRRTLTPEEREFFAGFVTSAAAREQLAIAIDSISLASYTGNLIVTGDEGMDTMGLIKSILRDVQLGDSNFSGKVAKITGESLNRKNLRDALGKLNNGAMIVAGASAMTEETSTKLHQALQQENLGVIVVLEDTKKAINAFLKRNAVLKECFTARMDMEKLSNEALVEIGKQYARELEFSIDELGGLALHTRVQQLQTVDHVVTAAEVKEIIDEAIVYARKKTPAHFFDVVFGKRYDDEDMIVLTEKDFIRH